MSDPTPNPSAPAPQPSRDATLKELYCAFHGCPADAFERHLFKRTVRLHLGWFAGICFRLWPDSFRRDFRELTVAGHVASRGQLRDVAADLRNDPREPRTFLRDFLGIRVSGRKLMSEAETVWKHAADASKK